MEVAEQIDQEVVDSIFDSLKDSLKHWYECEGGKYIYQAINDIAGKIPDDLFEAVYLDELNHITNEITWMIRSKLENNTLEGMDELTIMVSDIYQIVTSVLNFNGIPINYSMNREFTDDELSELFTDDEIL